MTRSDRQGRVLRAARLLTACAPAAVGVFGWLAAHLLTFWLLAHTHGGSPSPAGRHLHHYTAATALLAGCLAAASLLATLISAPSRQPPRSKPTDPAMTARRAAWMSTLAFIGSELLEHTVFGGDRKPPVILVAGLLLHAFAGALAALTWRQYRDAVHKLRSATGPPAALDQARPQRTNRPRSWPRRPYRGSSIAGRAPPAILHT